MAAKQQKTTYTAAEVAVLESTIQNQQSHLGKSVSHEKLETLMPWSGEVQQRYGEKAQTETV